MHLKVFVKQKKALKALSSGQKTKKKPKKTKKNKKTHWAGFFLKPGFFFQPWRGHLKGNYDLNTAFENNDRLLEQKRTGS